MSKFNQPKTVTMDVNEQNAKSLESGVFYFFYIYIYMYTNTLSILVASPLHM